MAEIELNGLPQELRRLHTKGMEALQRDNFDYAIELFMQVLRGAPACVDCRRALRQAQLGKSGAKSGLFKKMLSGASTAPLVAKGQIALHGNPTEALLIAEQILSTDPNSSAGHKLAAEAVAELGRSRHSHGMTRILPFLALALLFGCSSADDMPDYKKQSGDLGAFILQQSSKFGARAQQTNALPQFTAEWRYKEDADGFQIYITGDHFTQLQSFLTAAFGSPAKPPTTNELAGTKSIGTYYGPQLGAALNYGWETTRDGKQFTSMVVVRASALK